MCLINAGCTDNLSSMDCIYFSFIPIGMVADQSCVLFSCTRVRWWSVMVCVKSRRVSRRHSMMTQVLQLSDHRIDDRLWNASVSCCPFMIAVAPKAFSGLDESGGAGDDLSRFGIIQPPCGRVDSDWYRDLYGVSPDPPSVSSPLQNNLLSAAVQLSQAVT